MANGVYVDCTVGGGGHAALVAERMGGGKLLALDRDASAVEQARARLRPYRFATVIQGNFGNLQTLLEGLNFPRPDGVLIDAGLSSMQLDDPERGFTFQKKGPLDMRMDRGAGQTAAQYLASVSREELGRVLKTYGDLSLSEKLAGAILDGVQASQMNTSEDLAATVRSVFDFVHGEPNETRQVFQAVRMAVNEELRWLEAGIRQALDVLAEGGRLVCISFHSGEDRVVKNIFREHSKKREALYPDGRVKDTFPPLYRVLTPKPIRASADEIRANPRAQSAKLRAAERRRSEVALS